MDPYSAAIGAVAQLGGKVFDFIGAGEKRKLQREAADLAKLGVGELQGGKGYDPTKALEFLGLTDKSAYDAMDPAAKGASMEALQALVQRGRGSGMDIQSRQSLNEALMQSGAAQNAARQAILNEYTARGGGGAGADLAAMLTGQQANYQNSALASGQAAAAAEQRRLEANVLATRAGQGQQGLEQQKAAALDLLQRFNVGARQNALEQERLYRQGGANAYQGAANTMLGLAAQPSPTQAQGNAIAGGLTAAGNLAQSFLNPNTGGTEGELTGWNPGGGGDTTNLGNWSANLSPQASSYSYGSQLPENKLRSSVW